MGLLSLMHQVFVEGEGGATIDAQEERSGSLNLGPEMSIYLIMYQADCGRAVRYGVLGITLRKIRPI